MQPSPTLYFRSLAAPQKKQWSGDKNLAQRLVTKSISRDACTQNRPRALTDEGVAVVVQHGLVLALGRLHHERVHDGPRESGSVHAVVLETLADVCGFNLCRRKREMKKMKKIV